MRRHGFKTLVRVQRGVGALVNIYSSMTGTYREARRWENKSVKFNTRNTKIQGKKNDEKKCVDINRQRRWWYAIRKRKFHQKHDA